LGGSIKHFSVSINFSGSCGHNNLFFKDTVAHIIDVSSKSDFK
jgi:hypothetical protein